LAFYGVEYIEIEKLKLTQIYLSKKKIDAVSAWLGKDLINFNPVTIHDFMRNGQFYLTDGHTRAFVAWQKGAKKIPVIYDEDDIVTSEMGQILYKNDIEWCTRFGLNYIFDLKDRILNEDDYNRLWIVRCNYMHILEEALFKKYVDRDKFLSLKYKLEQQGRYVYGISKNFQTLYCENSKGELFCYSSGF